MSQLYLSFVSFICVYLSICQLYPCLSVCTSLSVSVSFICVCMSALSVSICLSISLICVYLSVCQLYLSVRFICVCLPVSFICACLPVSFICVCLLASSVSVCQLYLCLSLFVTITILTFLSILAIPKNGGKLKALACLCLHSIHVLLYIHIFHVLPLFCIHRYLFFSFYF